MDAQMGILLSYSGAGIVGLGGNITAAVLTGYFSNHVY
jgi:hypothetical protein